MTNTTDNRNKLYSVAFEILTTDKNYFNDLNMLKNVFYEPILLKAKNSSKFYPTVKQIEVLFLNIQPLIDFHSVLISRLEASIKEWENKQEIGKIFKELSPYIKLYTFYITGYGDTEKAVQIYKKKFPKFASFLAAQQKRPECKNLGFMHHMLAPIQRVPRYQLLLAEYLKYLPKDHPDYADCKDAEKLVIAAANHANDRIKEYNSSLRLLKLQSLIPSFNFISPGRIIINEGHMIRVTKKQNVPVLLIHLSDYILDCTHIAHKKYKMKYKFATKDIVVSKDTKEGNYLVILHESTFLKYTHQDPVVIDTWLKELRPKSNTILSRTLLRSKKSFSRESVIDAVNKEFPARSARPRAYDDVETLLFQKSNSEKVYPVLTSKVDIAIDTNVFQRRCVVLSIKKEIVVFKIIEELNENQCSEWAPTILKVDDILFSEALSGFKIIKTKVHSEGSELVLKTKAGTKLKILFKENEIFCKWKKFIGKFGFVVKERTLTN